MNTKKYIMVAGAGVIMLAGFVSWASAELMISPGPHTPTTDNVQLAPVVTKPHPVDQVVQIGPRANVLLRGSIMAIGTNSLTVKSWGGDWMVNISSTTKLMPGSDMSQFKVGDFVGVQGVVNSNASWTVDAKLVRNWSAKKR